MNKNLRVKKIASYVIATIIEGSVNKLQKFVTPTITFVTIPGQITLLSEMRFVKQDAHTMTNLNSLFSNCVALAIKYFPI